MSYLALARKWRPKKFSDVAGQDHVVRALSNALEGDQVHHAYLFAGTRGIGKTTVARILAKALNCAERKGAEPCGTCTSCVNIDEGRFVDLIEVDAASRTKVDQTRELLDNVQYMPTAARYKVYLIDEVHMLSGHSFNALLKTLEEPPPHVKFLLATTDPQKLPVTVLSRCLQFNLKRMSTALIVERMREICTAESIEAETGALARIGRAAAGSMRDGLSLLDQALSFGGGTLRDSETAEMLGSLDLLHLRQIMNNLIAGDAPGLIRQVRELQELVPDYELLLDDLATLLQQIAVVQMAGIDCLDEDADVETIQDLSGQISDELVQLWYQMAITSRRDLPLAPDPRTGFEMSLLRMLAFRPAGTGAVSGGGKSGSGAAKAKTTGAVKSGAAKSAAPTKAASGPVEWNRVVGELGLKGAPLELARNCTLTSQSTSEWRLQIKRSSEYLLSDQQQTQVAKAVKHRYGKDVQVYFDVVDAALDTLAARDQDAVVQKMDSARAAIESDPVVKNLIELFGAKVDPESIRPVDRGRKH